LKQAVIVIIFLSDGFELSAVGNSQDKLVSVGAQTTQKVEGKNVIVTGAYNLLKKCVSGTAELAVDDTTVKLAYDNVAKDPKLTVSQKIDASNVLKPSISLKVCIIFLDHFSHTLIGMSLCVLRRHIERRFCNPHVVILVN
jgi:hypothetical protein